MRRGIFAVVIATLFQVGAPFAAGPFDGEWTGKSLTSRLCRKMEMTLSIHDGKVEGRTVRENGVTANFRGGVSADGTLKAHLGKITGTMTADTAEVVFHTQNEQCPDVRFALTKAK